MRNMLLDNNNSWNWNYMGILIIECWNKIKLDFGFDIFGWFDSLIFCIWDNIRLL